ncbi:hypothetical protein P3T36_001034 [Kitasatospora sp. MAP12-15]|uniref:G1 family glutamic endopeptidase n=1 Tax=unclassified Kitasatospora TaxID=2633591 RepID=UPI0024745CF6|nr:G1 family glutamic endopeptidase [Kitasatospora sp. MAP12-44]MDH6114682.1 hypothetical protein [Kitasatospora sp. MAP12-44]
MFETSSARLLAVAAGLAVAVLAAPAAAAATPADTATSGIWAGYQAGGPPGSFTSVSASWIQPAVTCGSQDTYASFWVGLDGSGPLEQTGTEADCLDGRPVYRAWSEVLPAAETPYSVTVQPGDHLTGSVVDNGDGTFTMTVADSTQNWTQSTVQQGSAGSQDSTAEVVAEAPQLGGRRARLSDFGTVNFTGATANGSPLGGYSPLQVVMGDGDGGTVLAQPGPISAGDFAVTWENGG